MAFDESNFSQEMEIFKSQLKNAADVFDKMPEFEQIKALDVVKDLFNHLQSSLGQMDPDRSSNKLINADISLTEQDLINCLVIETQQDDILNWNETHLTRPENGLEEQSKSCGSLQDTISDLSNVITESLVQLEHTDSLINEKKSAIDETNCDNNSCNSCNTDKNEETMTGLDGFEDVSKGPCNETCLENKSTRRTSQRLANKKSKTKNEEENGENSIIELESKRRTKKQIFVCDKCGEKFEEEKEYKSHQHEEDEEASQKTEEFSCQECNLKFSHQQHFQKHMSGHHRNNCKLCSAQFAKRKALCRHMRVTHMINEPEKLYHCPHCERKFMKRPSLYVHLKEHAKGKIVCMKCGLMCETKETFSEHMSKHSEEAKFHCKKCNESFLRRQQYEQHLTGHDKYNCTNCDINFSTKKHLLKHKRVVHGIQTREEKKHICFICQKKFQRPMLLEIHMRLHTGEKPIQCTHCDKNFRTPKALAKHMKTAAHLKATGQDESDASEMDKRYLCAQCGTKFYRRQGLIRHMQQLHSEERPYTCPYCDYSCKCKTNLKRHVELHTADRRFVCELCGASFHARATLKEHHAYVHSEDRNFLCSVCGKGFKGRSGLRRHVRIHSDARPYVCYCAQSYKRMSHLKRHMIAIHGALFKSKRVSKITADENSQSSSMSGNAAGGESLDSLKEKSENLLLNVENVDLLQVQELLPSNQHLSLPSVSPLPTNQPPAHIFSSDVNYSHDYPLSSSSSSSDVANHFTFCMSLSQPFTSSNQLVQNSQFFPPTESTSLLLQDHLQVSNEMPTDKMNNGTVSTVPKMFAHSTS